MPKPWEKYAQPAAPPQAAAGPWAKYGVPRETEWQPRQRSVEELRQGKGFDPAEGMSQAERYYAGLGESLDTTWRGLKQAGTSAAEYFARTNPILTGDAPFTLEQILRPQPQRSVAGLVSGKDDTGSGRLRERMAAQQAEQARAERINAPLNQTAAGATGNIVGTVGQFMSPALALRGTALGAAFLPRTVAGNALLGGTAGGLQPVTDERERTGNVALGGGFGALGAAIPKVVGAAARPVIDYVSRFTPSGVRRRAAEQIASEAGNIGNLLRSSPSAVPGVRRTLAEETLDPGIARLERNARSTGQGFDPIDRANNEARVAALRQFAGDEAQVAAAEGARDTAALPLLREAKKAVGADTSRLTAQIDRGIAGQRQRPLVQQALRDARQLFSRPATEAEKAASPNWPDVVPEDQVAILYNARKTLNDWIGGKFGSGQDYMRAAQSELLAIRNQLDRVLTKASPEFGEYLKAYRQGSKAVDRMQLGSELIERGGGSILDPVTGQPVLTPAAFGRQAGQLDKAAASATGFRKAKAADILKPEDMTTIRAIQDDLNRRSFAATAGSGGNSQTFERAALENRLAGNIAGGVPIVGKFADILNNVGNSRVKAQVTYLLQNPEEARRALAALPPADRRVLQDVLTRLGGSAGIVAPALTE